MLLYKFKGKINYWKKLKDALNILNVRDTVIIINITISHITNTFMP